MITSNIKHGVLATALAATALFAPAAGAESVANDQWTFALTPYLWLPTINGSLQYQLPQGTPDVETGPNDYLSNLQMAVMLSGEARKGKWSLFSDLIYLDFESENSRVKSLGGNLVDVSLDLGTESSLKGAAWTLVGGYTAVHTPRATLDINGGFRYFGLKASTDWQLNGPIGIFPSAGSVSESKDLWDAIIGMRGRVQLSNDGHWSMPYYADIGTGNSSLTWQAMLGASYNWSWGDLSLVYRHLSYDMDSGELIQDLEFSGPALGATFRF